MFSPSAIALASYTTVSAGYLPTEVSWANIKESTPSKTDDVTSWASLDLQASLETMCSRTWD